MHREHRKWRSAALGREMDLLVFGHRGTAILAFPTACGRFHEWEDAGMVEALRPQLEEGLNRLVCVDSVDDESFENRMVGPDRRIGRHLQYERYVVEEVIPFVQHLAGSTFTIAAGAGLGGYHAANLVFKHPWHFGKLVSLDGRFDIRPYLDGYYADDVYFNSPFDYLPGLTDPHYLGWIRRNHLLLVGHGAASEPTRRLSGVLENRGIVHTLDVRDDATAGWPAWAEAMQRHVA